MVCSWVVSVMPITVTTTRTTADNATTNAAFLLKSSLVEMAILNAKIANPPAKVPIELF